MVWSSRQSVYLEHRCTGFVMEGEIIVSQEQGPPSLPSVEFPSCHEVLEVFVICPDLYRLLGQDEPMSPLLKSSYNSKHLFVMDFVIPLGVVKTLGREPGGFPISISFL